MTDNDQTRRNGMLQSAMDEFLELTRALANLVGSVGGSALSAMPEPVPATVNRMLRSLQQLSEVAPALTTEFEVLVEELHAQRLTVQALQAELSAFDHQLEVLENSLAPMKGWAHQWAQLRQSLAETLHSAVPEPGSEQD
jgi:Skp family chaperone for outer membrane proteins